MHEVLPSRGSWLEINRVTSSNGAGLGPMEDSFEKREEENGFYSTGKGEPGLSTSGRY